MANSELAKLSMVNDVLNEDVPAEDLILNIDDLERAGSKKLSRHARDYFNSGATDQVTYLMNRTAFAKFLLRPRVLVDVSECDTSVKVMGRTIPFPVCISPTAFHQLAHPDGELATARAAASFGVTMGMSSYSNLPWDEIIVEGRGLIDFAAQLYIYPSRELQLQLVKRAERLGCKAIFLTSDAPILGTRWNETRNAFVRRIDDALGGQWPFPNLPDPNNTIKVGGMEIEPLANLFQDAAQNWERDIPYLRSITNMKIFVKGVLTAEDTLKAIEQGVDGIIVSNHGGRQLDGVLPTIDALLPVVDAAKSRIPIFVDGGFRRGSDVFKALAIGADCVFIGRPILWGLAYDGAAGVELALKMLQDEFRKTMQLMGCRTVQDISRSHLAIMNSNGFVQRLDEVLKQQSC